MEEKEVKLRKQCNKTSMAGVNLTKGGETMITLFQAIGETAPVKRPIDEEWIACIAAGDMDALRRLYDAVGDKVYGFALSLVRHPQDAEDVLQETFLRIHAHAGEYRPQGKPLAWIFTIARHLALDKCRQQSRMQTLPDAEAAVDLSAVTQADQRMLLDHLLNHLTQEDRQILILHAVVGMKHREIAAVMGLPLNTVLSRYHRGLNRLKSIVKEELLRDE